MPNWFVEKIIQKNSDAMYDANSEEMHPGEICWLSDFDYHAIYLGTSDFEKLITSEKEKITKQDVAKTLEYLIAKKSAKLLISTLLEQNLPITPTIIQSSLDICCNTKKIDYAIALAENNLQRLNAESLTILMESKNRQLQSLAIKAIKESKQENMVNMPNKSGLAFAEIAIINKDYRLATELVNVGADFNRALALGGPRLSHDLHPTFFCHRNHNDAKLQRLLLKVNDQKFINNEFENVFNDTCNKKLNDTALERIAKLPFFKERLFDYIESLNPSLIKETCEKAITAGDPLNTLFKTPCGRWSNPNPSNGYIRKILQKLADLDKTEKSTPLSVEQNQQIPTAPISFFATQSNDPSLSDTEISEPRISYTSN